MRGEVMKIVVIGGTGLIGSKVVEKLKQKGHEAIAAAPNTGVNTITGEGLKEAMAGAKAAQEFKTEAWRPVRVAAPMTRRKGEITCVALLPPRQQPTISEFISP